MSLTERIIQNLKLCINECEAVKGTREVSEFAFAVREMAAATRFLVASTKESNPDPIHDLADYEDFDSARRDLEVMVHSFEGLRGVAFGDEAAEVIENLGPTAEELLVGIRRARAARSA